MFHLQAKLFGRTSPTFSLVSRSHLAGSIGPGSMKRNSLIHYNNEVFFVISKAQFLYRFVSHVIQSGALRMLAGSVLAFLQDRGALHMASLVTALQKSQGIILKQSYSIISILFCFFQRSFQCICSSIGRTPWSIYLSTWYQFVSMC